MIGYVVYDNNVYEIEFVESDIRKNSDHESIPINIYGNVSMIHNFHRTPKTAFNELRLKVVENYDKVKSEMLEIENKLKDVDHELSLL